MNKEKRQLIGSTLIVAGTAIGAGMLAIPLVTARMGFGYSVIFLFLCWLVMALTAFLVLEANMAFERTVSFSTMAKHLLGPVGQVVTWLSYCLLLYALTAAYVAGGGSLLEMAINKYSHWHLSPSLAALIFTVILGAVVVAGTSSVDVINRLLMTAKLILFVFLLVLLMPRVNASFLKSQVSHFSSIWITIPILITAYGFHIVIPPLRAYLKDDVAKMRKVLWFGASLPLLIYFLWEFVTLGVLPAQGPVSFAAVNHANTSIGGMVAAIQDYLHATHLSIGVSLFSDIAVTTSFLGVSLGLMHFLVDGFNLSKERWTTKPLVVLLTYVPPLLFALFYPHGFIMALGYASIFVAVLLILLPVMMVWRLRKHHLHQGIVRYRFGIGRVTMALIFLAGVVVIALQVLTMLHDLPV